MSTAVRAKPAVEYVAMVSGDIVGIVTTHGYDEQAAEQAAALIVAKQQRVSRGTVTVCRYEDCPAVIQRLATEAEATRWRDRLAGFAVV